MSTMKSGATPRSIDFSGDSIRAMCSSARISAVGLRVNSTADASARYSRSRESAIATSLEKSHPSPPMIKIGSGWRR
jgi:hypothetical protein